MIFKVVYSFTVLFIVLLSHLFILQQLSVPMVINHATPSPQPLMVNLIVATPKSAVITASQLMPQSKIKNLPPILNPLKNSEINKSNQSVKIKIAPYKKMVQQPVKKIKLNQRSPKSQLIQSVKIKTHAVKPPRQPVQFKPQVTTFAEVNNLSAQSVIRKTAVGKIMPAALNQNYSPKTTITINSVKQIIQPLRHQSIISPQKQSQSIIKNRASSKTLAPVFLGDKPPYPWLSRRHNETGKVLLRVQVNTQGKATIIQIKQSSGSSRLDNAAVNHVQNSAFIPAQQNGNPIIGWKELRFVFQLN